MNVVSGDERGGGIGQYVSSSRGLQLKMGGSEGGAGRRGVVYISS
jgi:hypothetical protein